jgi:hypothetical protein
MTESLVLKLDYSEPVELTGLSRSLTKLGQRYARFARINDVDRAALHITRVSEGSLVIDLAPLILLAGVPEALPTTVNTVAEFVRNLKKVIDYFLGQGPRPEDLTRRDCDDVRDIVQPITTQSDGFFNIQAKDNSSVTVNINLNPTEANAVQNRALREREALFEPDEERFEGAIFYWQRADRSEGTADGHSPDRGVIESIDRKARKVFFEDPTLKQTMLGGGAIFDTGYIVDGDILWAKERIQGYRITAVHDSFPLES